MPALSSTTEFIDLFRRSGIYQAGAFDDAMAKVPDLPDDPTRAATVFVQRGVLTKFQARLLLNGRSRGFRLGSYVIQDQLGQGGMGTVFLAEHTTLRRLAAVKVLTLPKDVDGTDLALERFLREARAAAALDHPNIVRINDVANQDGIHYITLEYVDGVTLEQLLQKGGPVTPSRAVEYIAQAAAGLQHADERGFVHRDIKPANLILTRDQKTLKILDMGLARSFAKEEDKLTERLEHGAIAGTVDFIAPEQSLGAVNLDIRADIYSLGATFFTLLTGRPPFQGNTTQKLAQHQMKPAPDLTELDPTLPAELAAVVAKMLAKKPKDRYQTPADVIAALAPWLGQSRTNLPGVVGAAHSGRIVEGGLPSARSTVRAGTAGTERRTTRRKKKAKPAEPQKKTLLIAAGALGALLVVVLVAVLASGGKKPELASNVPGGNQPVTPSVTQPVSTPPRIGPSAPQNQQPAVKPPAGAPGELLYHIDFANLETSSLSAAVGEKVYTQRLGGQSLPLGWGINHHEPAAAAEFAIADFAGARALEVRRVRFERTEVVCKLDAVLSTPGVNESRTFRVEYQFDGPGLVQFGIKIDKAPYVRPVLEPLAPTSGGWRQAEFVFTRQTNDPVMFSCNISPDPKAPTAPTGAFRLRSLDVWKGRAAAAAPAAPAAPTALANRFAGWRAGTVVYRSDLGEIEPFQVTKEGAKIRAGAPEQLPKGIRASCWKPTAVAEFRCESTGISRALGLANLSDDKAGRIAFELEREMDLRLTPGKAYRVTVEYATQSGASGGMVVQAPGTTVRNVLQIPLTASDDIWKTVSGEFERRDGEPIRLSLESFTVGAEKVLSIRSVEVTELVKPD
ncbi:serine/threonine protein kinase [Gemmata sp. JC673]|uniref:Serine/threonine protein kinase n=1 Tax=Gemmata algarum TaxID=2975278 RepID=A0ABU5EZM9_9BACT|nr:serine/threonine-protein kinase [Gemmata algarum]MDY3560404.1 serine/threonine protein kinase [Gemmata algarum]